MFFFSGFHAGKSLIFFNIRNRWLVSRQDMGRIWVYIPLFAPHYFDICSLRKQIIHARYVLSSQFDFSADFLPETFAVPGFLAVDLTLCKHTFRYTAYPEN